uniref:Ribosomal protein L6 n=1 Tax=Hildenbrandia rubra TaxID=31481 RepID=A0A1C9CG97_9FLOR|nr:ribosomal protein L6 [Hildenbrandia rubra]AOM67420.1 ribosomal protein L6 [Hildenbrandia rubra]|eukprot:Plantae.Rhodophyta-Hildenbrandia_rubra.ctg41168.p1 GENE.Plantae.Rhodophyta-Hildenbrandia_rubra.ctg41168~~Plantae.Rhodophyta-Hildenbrandia_rubra.ctg41168.p1  ORF type:complete len:179 (+),score=8.25 Plantae.Rhodophyta-Hildenbrandia_rubra.ctg41168:356-892(+)
MSRIGKKPIRILDDIKVDLKTKVLIVHGPQGTLELDIPDSIETHIVNNQIILQKIQSDRKSKAVYGLYRTLINNMIIGAHRGFFKHLVIQGVGYRAQMDKNLLVLSMGYSHIVNIIPPKNIYIKTLNNTEIIVSGPDKALVGQIAAKIRAVRPPEPYKGKGIRYKGEFIRQKVGKTGK